MTMHSGTDLKLRGNGDARPAQPAAALETPRAQAADLLAKHFSPYGTSDQSLDRDIISGLRRIGSEAHGDRAIGSGPGTESERALLLGVLDILLSSAWTDIRPAIKSRIDRLAREAVRREHQGYVDDEVFMAAIAGGLSYRKAAEALSGRCGRKVTKRQVEEAVKRMGGLGSIRVRSRELPGRQDF